MSIDLHVHSNASDGTLTPVEVVEEAIARGLTAVGIVDHDTMRGLPSAAAAAAGRITFIPGVEISTQIKNAEMHILGYLMAQDYQPLLDELQHVREERISRIHRTVTRLQELAVRITFDDIVAACENVTPGHCEDEAALGRPHVAAALVRTGAVRTPAEAFDRYLRRGRPAYVDRYRAEPARAIELIREAGGIAVLAHPGLMHRDSIIPTLIEQGLGGIEAYHVSHTPSTVRRYLEMAERLGLIVTGGTDSHGPKGTTPVEIGAVDVPDAVAERLLEWKAAK
ncbi:MAG: PHP domain-containing protein [Armatimonadota bacterium]